MKTRRQLRSLDALNRQARERAYGIDAIDWSHQVDRSKPWAPEGIGALWYVPAFAGLDDVQRLRSNQLYALALAEKSIWFEEFLIRAISKVLDTATLPSTLGESLRHFVCEESKHTAMFGRLLQCSEPGWYRAGAHRFFR